MKKRIKIGILGSRGIPNNYGGFEQLAEYLSIGLSEMDIHVSVYNSHNHPVRDKTWKGVHRIFCYNPEKRVGAAGQFIYDLLCIIDAGRRDFDVILQLGYTTNAIWYWLLPKKAVIITNMDGMEWQRSKYGYFIRKFLRFSELLAVKSSHFLICDSIAIQHYYREKYGRDSEYIAYGVNQMNKIDPYNLSRYNLYIKSYMLVIARMQQDNNIETIIKGFLNSKTTKTLIIIGNYNNQYGKYLRRKYNFDRINFLGEIFNKTELDLLRYFSFLYFHGHSCGGTNPSLLEAMAASAKIVAHDNPYNRSVLNEYGTYFKTSDDITRIINANNRLQPTDLFEKSQHNLLNVHKYYSWEKIFEAYKNLIVKSFEKIPGS